MDQELILRSVIALEEIANNYWGLIFSAIGAVAAGLSAWFAYRAVITTKETQMDLLRPILVPISEDPLFNREWIKFKIKNIGQGPLVNMQCPQNDLQADIKIPNLAIDEKTDIFIPRNAEDIIAKNPVIRFQYNDTYGRICETEFVLTVREQGGDHGYKYDFGWPERWGYKSKIIK